ncbi:hypothetical protein D9758_009576 [Tetrapyrgos nigripes]|uniref:Uncharacterized protein n=1 Tax=Tetrapyrgos nigripes TaxID=182062 RepID=A0A8H5LMJ1_9AGAR|nr:hypothetical protein D9758_009576 [Tetrapyrgos nigripes]
MCMVAGDGLNLGWFDAARRASMMPEHLIDCAKLYDSYVNGFDEGKSRHKARVHLAPIHNPSSTIPHIHSAPTLTDLLNAENLEPKEADLAGLEEQWFNNPDPYDLGETDRVDDSLKVDDDNMTVIRSQIRFNIAEYIKLDDKKLISLLTNVDYLGPGASADSAVMGSTPVSQIPKGKPGAWDISQFLK